MTDIPRSLIDETLAALRPALADASRHRFVAGFDAFIDVIMNVVDQRTGPGDAYSEMREIRQFGDRINEASGRSTSIEVIAEPPRLGGNGPLLARGLGRFGMPMTYVGNVAAVGDNDKVHPVFQPLKQYGAVIPLCPPAFTDAYEFGDGKVMLSRASTLDDVTPESIERIVGRERLGELLGRASLVALVNWTKIPAMTRIWRYLLDDILPTVTWFQEIERPLAFFDLADPVTRSREALREACDTIAEFSQHYRVIFGMNLKEGAQVAAALGMETLDDAEAIAAFIQEKLSVDEVVVHPVPCAAVATADGLRKLCPGPTCGDPLTTTGGGDNFNAGYCFARALGLGPEQALCIGKATSGYYVRTGISPEPKALVEFLESWREGSVPDRLTA